GLADLRGMALSSAVTQLAGGRWGCSHQRSRELLSLLKAVKPVHFQRAAADGLEEWEARSDTAAGHNGRFVLRRP
ncbi:MAG: hypothetical protein U0904_11725, partial [Candidatus Nanopelagicales bacterium]|nr:hypothetical protein [Candidatus Nanopelagicales bacterium]